MTGILYIIATPIGNLGDITYRAEETLKAVDFIAAEDTRHSGRLLKHLQIKKPLLSLHAHNEQVSSEKIITKLKAGNNIAYISDAGTPLISDPGLQLVRLCYQHNITLIPIPGPSALITALSIAGFPAQEFIFVGFLPPKAKQRQDAIAAYCHEVKTLVFYEAPHRIITMLEDLAAILGKTREAFIAREITKRFETYKRGSLQELIIWLQANPTQVQGEFVVIVAGYEGEHEDIIPPTVVALLTKLLTTCSVKEAAKLVHDVTLIKKNVLYEMGVRIKG